MNEQALRKNIERIEKKFYRTTSDKTRLDDLQIEIGVLQHEKKLLANEFKEKENAANSKPFIKKTFTDLLNSLKKDNNKLIKVKGKLVDKIQYLSELENKEKIAIEPVKMSIKQKEEILAKAYSEVTNNEYNNEQLMYKLSSLANEVSVIKKKITDFTEINNIQEFQLRSIADKKLVAKYKEMFSITTLEKQKHSINDVSSFRNSTIDAQTNVVQKNKSIVNKLYDNCANVNFEFKKLMEQHENVISEVTKLEAKGDENAKLQKNQAFIAQKTEKLHKVVDILNDAFPDFIFERENSTVRDSSDQDDPYDFNFLTKQILSAYTNALHVMNINHKTILELQHQIESKKYLQKDLNNIAKSSDPNVSTLRVEVSLGGHIENNQIFINVQNNVGFLVKCKNFVIAYCKRLHKVIDAINKVCTMLDFDYQFIIMNPFFNSATSAAKRRSNPDILASHLVMEGAENTFNNSTFGTRANDKGENKGNYKSNRMTMIGIPFNYLQSFQSLSGVMQFFEEILGTFSSFREYFVQVQVECSSDFKKRKMTLSKSFRTVNKRKPMGEKQSIYKSRNTNLRDKSVR